MYGNNYNQPPQQTGQMYGAGQQQGQYGAPPQQQYGAPPQQQYGAPPQQQYGAPPQQQYGQQPQQGGWNAPPQQNFNQQNTYGQPPQQQFNQQQPYGAPPPQNQYGAPPQQQYGAPPQNQYGAPPTGAQGAYGAPPVGGYGAPGAQQPAYGAQQSYGAPAQQPGQFGQGGPTFFGISIPAPPPAPPLTTLQGYNAQFDADRIRSATKGFGTNEKILIDVLSSLDPFQVDVLARTYEQMNGRSLQKTLEKELSSWLEFVLVLVSLGPLGGDVYLLNRACKGIGTHEDLLTEILIGRTNQEMHLLKEGYRRVYNKDLVQVVRGELSMKTERMFNMALAGTRDESTFVNQQQVQQDIEALYRAGRGRIGTDEIAICGIMLSRSDAHLQAIAQGFPQRHRVSLSKVMESEFSGHMKDALVHVARGAENDGQGVHRDMLLIEAAMAGMGTKDERLCYRIVRAHWNRPRFNAIKNAYQQQYRTTLQRRVEGETSGKYETALVALITMN